MTNKPIDPKIEQLMHKFEERVRKEWGSAIHITFWGTLILDPNKVWVTHEQAERSMKTLLDPNTRWATRYD